MIPQAWTTWWSCTGPRTNGWWPESLRRAPISTSISVTARCSTSGSPASGKTWDTWSSCMWSRKTRRTCPDGAGGPASIGLSSLFNTLACCSRGSAWRSFHSPIIPSPESPRRDSGDTSTPAGKDPLTGNGKQGYRRPWNGAILRHRALEHTCRGFECGRPCRKRQPLEEDGDRLPVKPFPSYGFRPERLPLWLLLLALSTLFLCSFDKGYFYRPGPNDWNTAKNLAIAENLSPDHGFRLFLRCDRQGPGDAPTYGMYSHFPVGGYALIKLAILPFGTDLSARILAARMLMLLLFSAAALLAFHSLARITSHRWVALAAVLAAFSSFYMLLYSNAISVEMSVDLFAVMLVFHGMVVFVQEGRFRQLLARTCVALLLGWHVYAFLLPFLILGSGERGGPGVEGRDRAVAACAFHRGGGVAQPLHGAGRVLGAVRRGRPGLQLRQRVRRVRRRDAGERTAVSPVHAQPDRTGPGVEHRLPPCGLADLPATAALSCLRGLRSIRADRLGSRVCWRWFSSAPFSASGLFGAAVVGFPPVLLLMVAWSHPRPWFALRGRCWPGGAACSLATLALSGFFWALPMRHNTANLHPRLRGPVLRGRPAGVLLAAPAVRPQALGAWSGGRPCRCGAARLRRLHLPDGTTDGARTPGRPRSNWPPWPNSGASAKPPGERWLLLLESVKPDWSWQVMKRIYGWRYYLAGSVLSHSLHTEQPIIHSLYYLAGSVLIQHFPDVETAARAADFLVTRDRVESDALLTPGNEQVFLYDSAGMDDLMELYRTTYQRAVSGEPAARSHFDVYLGDGTLIHVREPCVRDDV